MFENMPLATNKLNMSNLLTNGGYALDGNYYSGIDTAVVLPRQQPTALFAPAQLPWLAGICCDLFVPR